MVLFNLKLNNLIFLILLFILYFNLISSTIECAPPLFKTKRNLNIKNKRIFSFSSHSFSSSSHSSSSHSSSSSSSSSSGDDHESPDHDTEGPQILYFFCFGLLLGCITSYLLPRLKSKIPYTVIMFVEGMISAVIYMHFDKRILSFFLSFLIYFIINLFYYFIYY